MGQPGQRPGGIEREQCRRVTPQGLSLSFTHQFNSVDGRFIAPEHPLAIDHGENRADLAPQPQLIHRHREGTLEKRIVAPPNEGQRHPDRFQGQLPQQRADIDRLRQLSTPRRSPSQVDHARRWIRQRCLAARRLFGEKFGELSLASRQVPRLCGVAAAEPLQGQDARSAWSLEPLHQQHAGFDLGTRDRGVRIVWNRGNAAGRGLLRRPGGEQLLPALAGGFGVAPFAGEIAQSQQRLVGVAAVIGPGDNPSQIIFTACVEPPLGDRVDLSPVGVELSAGKRSEQQVRRGPSSHQPLRIPLDEPGPPVAHQGSQQGQRLRPLPVQDQFAGRGDIASSVGGEFELRDGGSRVVDPVGLSPGPRFREASQVQQQARKQEKEVAHPKPGD